MNRMTFACLAGVAAACGLAAWSTISWYKGRGSRDEKRVRKVAEQQEYNKAIAKQLA
jgi:predicted MFS family arabinose efflux permease